MTLNRLLYGVFGFVVMVLVAGVALSYATPQYAQETGQSCVVCHPNGPPELGPAGEYFKEKGTLEGYGELPEKKGEPGGRCTVCHAQLVPNPEPRDLSGAPAEPNHRFELKHGGGRFWCLTCHSAANRDMLRLFNGTEIPLFDNPVPLCAQCHGPVYEDWKDHIHGRWVGNLSNPRPALLCTGCHNPHDPKFKPIKPEKPPQRAPESPELPHYPVYSFIVLVLSIALAIYAAWR